MIKQSRMDAGKIKGKSHSPFSVKSNAAEQQKYINELPGSTRQ